MTDKHFPGVFIARADETLGTTLDEMSKWLTEYTMRAARGECAWVCSSCCCIFNDGMPDECAHGQPDCTKIIKRDKEDAKHATDA